MAAYEYRQMVSWEEGSLSSRVAVGQSHQD